jgi:hypothetical protein
MDHGYRKGESRVKLTPSFVRKVNHGQVSEKRMATGKRKGKPGSRKRAR